MPRRSAGTAKQQVPLPANYVGKNCGPSHKVVSVIVTNPGNGYTAQPLITIDRARRRGDAGHRHHTMAGGSQRAGGVIRSPLREPAYTSCPL